MQSRKRTYILIAIALILCCSAVSFAADSLAKGFQSPPDSARPWVYWFWLNGNITREGITADLEAMKRVGIGGVLIMEVDQGAPLGPVGFMSTEWRTLFKHVVSEAKRLGLEVNMNNDAGWNGSGGPWIKPDQSMQKVVWTDTDIDGSQHFDGMLAQPAVVAGFYRDITVQAFPTPGTFRIPNIQTKAGCWGGPNNPGLGGSSDGSIGPEMVIAHDKIIDISDKMDASGHLVWDVPPGKWTVVRFGHTSTGMTNAPAPQSGRGLECDKLSKEGAEANFNGMMAKLVADSGSAGVPTRMPTGTSALPGGLVATHVDSWENGSQNWTAKMRAEFLQRRGYDMLPFLPVMTGRVVGSPEISDRFLWDLRRTISELVIENYAGHIRDLAHANGLRFTIEAYGSPCDNIPYGGMADEPMGEFWDPSGAMETCKGMASSGHVYGKPIIGAEAFTAGGHERWLQHPASLKALGDQAFCEGINRFVFHRYAMQPWVDDRRPGMTMGPWGQHYERTQTWWKQTPAWHKYLARCQYLLRQGLFVADVCYLQPEAPPQSLGNHSRQGYNWDECSAEVVLTRMSVKNGRIVLPDGMSYRALVLSESQTMTPSLLRKISELVQAGATIVGPRPLKSPSLSDYPKCDDQVKSLSDEIWGNCDGDKVKEHRFGKGRVVWGIAPEKLLAQSGVGPDFVSRELLRCIHRRTLGGTDIYFVSNPRPHAVTAMGTFRVSGKTPELWWPDTGRTERAAVYQDKAGVTSVLLPLGPSGSVFVIFRESAGKSDPVLAVKHDGNLLFSSTEKPVAKIVVKKATYGILDDPQRTRDVRTKAQRIADSGESSLKVSEMAAGDDPAFGIVKTLVLEYTIDGKRVTATGTDPETIDLVAPAPDTLPTCELAGSGSGLKLTAWQPGRYTFVRASGKTREVIVHELPSPLEVSGPWKVLFPPNQGAPVQIKLDRLISLSEHPESGVKYFSGTATYQTTFDVPASLLADGYSPRLDLGDVQIMAEVKLNGKNLGLLWKRPFTMDVKGALKPGRNVLEVKVTNLWPNRMIGDLQLPEDSDRNPGGTLKSWPQWLKDGKPSPTGQFTFTSWRLWRKDEALLKSGLLGPVKLVVAQEISVR